MGSDLALYVAVAKARHLKRLLPERFDEVDLAEGCAYARAWHADRSPTQLGQIAREISSHHDAIVMGCSTVTDWFLFERYRDGRRERQLAYVDGCWRYVNGTPEPWERELNEPPHPGEARFDVWSACDLAGAQYRLTSW